MSASENIAVEEAVRERYSAGAQAREEALCCPIDYDPQYLKVIPQEVLDRDYGCGDPSQYVRSGDTVLDLGSGGGKICFIASQVVGKEGHVIGVDMNDEMLELAHKAKPEVAQAIGYDNIEFRRGRIQDLALPLDPLNAFLAANPPKNAAELEAVDDEAARLRRETPLVADQSVDIIVSNCVLNLVKSEQKAQLIQEMYRVLKVGGRIAISDIVSDEVVPQHLRDDAHLWSGCISGAFHEQEILRELEAAGFHGIAIDTWANETFQVVEGIEFRSVTVTAYKGKEGPCYEANQALMYAGPWSAVKDDDGHTFARGERVAVCAKTFGILTSEPYSGQMIEIEPHSAIPENERQEFDCARTAPRHPRETKGQDYALTTEASDCCDPEEACC